MRTTRFVPLLVALATASSVSIRAAGAQTTSAPPASKPAAPAGVLLSGERHKQVDAIFAPWSGTATPGCAVAISRDGLLDYARGYGMANLEYDIAITPESIFHVASISKQFAAFAVSLLAQEGKLSLDDDVRKYVPEVPDLGRKITIAHLMHHTSGLRDQWSLLRFAGWRDDDLITEQDVLWVVSKQRALNFEPGAEYVYSNTGYTLLGVIVARVSGQSLRDFANERIFKPLGMTDTHFHSDHTEVVRRRTSAYLPRGSNGWRVSIPVFDTYGATSLFTTVGDLLKWEQNFVDARVGGRALVDAVQVSGKLNGGQNINYGAGLSVDSYRGLRTVGHSGADAGYRADVVAFPDQRLVVAALCNGSSIGPSALTRRVAEVYLGDRMTPVAAAPAVTVAEAELSALAGTYWSESSDALVQLEVKEGALRRIGPSVPLVPLGNGMFRVGESGEWRFPAPPAGAPANAPRELHMLDDPLPPTVFTRVTAARPAVSALAPYAGQYRMEEVDNTYTVTVTDGALRLRWPRDGDSTLEPVGGDRFTGRVGMVTFTRNGAGQIDGLTISNGRVRRLRAERLPTPAPASTPSRPRTAAAARGR